MEKQPSGRQKLVHIMIGTPDEDNCPICKAHAGMRQEPVGVGGVESVRVEELSLHDVLRCSCPLCEQARKESLDE